MAGRVVVVGSSNIDLIMKMERLPRPGETVAEAEFAVSGMGNDPGGYRAEFVDLVRQVRKLSGQ